MYQDMKTFISYNENFFRIEVGSENRSIIHAYAHVFVQRRFGSLEITSYDIMNVDCTGSAFSVFSRFVVNSSPSYLLSKCSNGAEVDLCDDLQLNFEFD